MGTPSPAVSLRFGNCNNALNCGLWARTLNNAAANAWWNNGASLESTTWNINQNVPIGLTPQAVGIPLYPPLTGIGEC